MIFGDLDPIFSLAKLLRGQVPPWQLGFAAALGMVFGLTPLFAPHQLLVIFLLLSLRANFSMFILSSGFFAGLSYGVAPITHELGSYLLSHPDLITHWTAAYNSAFWRMFPFNNSVQLGNTLLSLGLLLPVAFSGSLLARWIQRLIQLLASRIPLLKKWVEVKA